MKKPIFAFVAAVGLILGMVGVSLPANAVDTSGSCTSNGKTWTAKASWSYLSAGKVIVPSASISGPASASRISVYDGAGVYVETQNSTTTPATWNPADPAVKTGKPYLRITAGCTITLTMPSGVPSSSPSPSMSPTASPSPSVTPTQPPAGSPVGGYSRLAFSDDFNGTSLDRAKWAPCWYYPGCGRMNESNTLVSNVTVSNGILSLRQSSASDGALVTTNKSAGAGTGFRFTTTGYAEARVWFPGNGSRCYNWPAWWSNGPESGYSDGEHDIAEILGSGQMTVNYHFGNNSNPYGKTIPGYWCDTYHTYGLHRQANKADVYFDGKLVASYPTTELASQELIFNTGYRSGKTLGVNQSLKVDWVKVWTN